MAKHFRILGLEGKMIPQDKTEKERIDSMPLADLAFVPKPRRRWFSGPLFTWQFALVPAMAVVFIVATFTPEEPARELQIKGGHAVRLFWERSGEVKPLGSDTLLQNGDRVRAVVHSASAVNAYLAIMNNEGRLLSTSQSVVDSRLALDAGEKGTFPGSLKLVGTDEGEIVRIILCDKPATMGMDDVTGLAGGHLPEACAGRTFKLR